MGETVTFRGSRNSADGTTVVQLPAEGDFEGLSFTKDVPVEGVAAKVIDRLQAQPDLKLFIFDVGDVELELTQPYVDYDTASVEDVVAFLESADVPTVAALKAYEAAHKDRKTIAEWAPAEPEGEPTA